MKENHEKRVEEITAEIFEVLAEKSLAHSILAIAETLSLLLLDVKGEKREALSEFLKDFVRQRTQEEWGIEN